MLSFHEALMSDPSTHTEKTEHLVNRVIEGADHGGVEVARLVFVVAHILLVAVRHLGI